MLPTTACGKTEPLLYVSNPQCALIYLPQKPHSPAWQEGGFQSFLHPPVCLRSTYTGDSPALEWAPWHKMIDMQTAVTRTLTKNFLNTLEPPHNAPQYKAVFSWTPNDFQNFQGVSQHKKFIYFRPYHCILAKTFSLVEENRRGEHSYT